jgi:RNA polymerase sigma factor (sigma-70 family)
MRHTSNRLWNQDVTLNQPEPSPERWQEALQAVAHGDRQAFAALFRHFAPKLKAFALAKPCGGNPSQFADELVQEVMIKVWNKAGSYNPALAGASTWIFTIARNCRIDMIRARVRSGFPLESEELLADMEADEASAPFESTWQRNLERDIRAGIRELPEEQAEVITQIYMEGKSQQEVADELALPLGTVKSRVRLALAKLKILVVH